MNWFYNIIQYLAYDVMKTDIHDEEFIESVLKETGMNRMQYEAIMFQEED